MNYSLMDDEFKTTLIELTISFIILIAIGIIKLILM